MIKWNKRKRKNMSSKENGKITKRKFVNMKMKNIRVKIQFDTGSDITIVN